MSGRVHCQVTLDNLLNELGTESHGAEERDRKRRDGGSSELASVEGTVESQHAEGALALLIRREERLVILGQAEHAGDLAAGGDGLDELECDAATGGLARRAALG